MWRGVVWVMLVGGLGLACGGRYERDPRESDVNDEAGSSSSMGGTAAGGFAGGGGGIDASSGMGGALAACIQQRSDYQQYYSEVMAEFAGFPCEADDDCRSYYTQSPCDPTCRLLTSAAHRGIIDRLNMFGAFNCDSDCFPVAETCPTAAPVHCTNRVCR